MAFPVVAARATGRTTTTDTTSHAITLPSGISAGDLLVVVFACDGNPTISVNTGASGTGWNQLTQASNGSIVSSNIFWKIASGSDILTLTTSASEQSSHVSLRITGGYSVTGTSSNGSSTNSNPPNHAAPNGTQDYLWIATRAGDSTTVATVAPTSFGNLQSLAAAGTGGASVNTAERSLNGSALDPATFTSATEQWASYTLAVSPVPPPVSGAGSGSLPLSGTGAGSVTGGGGGSPGPLTFGSYLWSGSVSATTYTFPNMAIGPAASDRWVIAAFGIHQRYSGSLTSVTIGGVAATKLYGEPTLAGSGTRFEFWKALVPTGNMANIAIVSSGDMWDGAGATYYCTGEPTYFDAKLDLTFTGSTFAVSIDVPEGGALVAHASNDDDGAISAWVGVTADASDDPFQSYFGSASQLSAESGRTVSFTATFPATADNFYGLAVLSVSVPTVGGGGGVEGSGSGTLLLAGSADGVAPAAGAGTGSLLLTGAGSGTVPAVGTGSGSLPLTGSGAGTVGSAATGIADGILPLTGSATGKTEAQGQGAGSLPLTGAASGSAEARGQGAGTLPLTGVSSGASRAAGTGSGSLPLTGSGAAAAPVVGSGSGVLPLTGSGSAVIGASAFGTGAGTLPLAGSGTARADARGQGTGALPLTGSAQGQTLVVGQAAGGLALTGSSTARAEARGSGAGMLPLAGSGSATLRAAGMATGVLSLAGSASAVALVAGTASGLLSLGGSAVGVVGNPADYATGRLAFASEGPRQGTILNTASRKGRVLNTAPRRGEIMNQARREGVILNPTRAGRIVELDE